jgi:hypothetical protein
VQAHDRSFIVHRWRERIADAAGHAYRPLGVRVGVRHGVCRLPCGGFRMTALDLIFAALLLLGLALAGLVYWLARRLRGVDREIGWMGSTPGDDA